MNRPTENPDDAGRRWTLDKHIPVALLIAIALQTCTAIWWAATTTARLNVLENAISNAVTLDGHLGQGRDNANGHERRHERHQGRVADGPAPMSA